MKNIYIGDTHYPTFAYANKDSFDMDDLDCEEETTDFTVDGIPVTKDGFRVIKEGFFEVNKPPLSTDNDGYWMRCWTDIEREDECRIFIPTCPQ